MLNLNLSTDNNQDLTDSFRIATERLCEILTTQGLKKIPYESPDLPHYNSLEKPQRQAALAQLVFYNQSLETLMSEKESLSNNAKSLWAALKKLKLIPPSDFFNILRDDDCIELYDAKHIQIWRNINMMTVMSHTIEQAFSLPWPSRYERDLEALQKCVVVVNEILQSGTLQTRHAQIKNLIREKNSLELFELDTVHTYLASVKNEENEVAGYLVVSKVEIIGSRKPAWASSNQETTTRLNSI